MSGFGTEFQDLQNLQNEDKNNDDASLTECGVNGRIFEAPKGRRVLLLFAPSGRQTEV
jgi:hypothetical protein